MSTFGIDHFISQLIQGAIDGAIQRRTASYNADLGAEVVELRPVNFIAWMGGIYVLMGVAFLFGSYVELPARAGWLLLAFGLACPLIGCWMIMFRSRYRVYFNEEKIYVRPWLGEIRIYAFAEMASAGTARNGKDLRITLRSGKKLTISHYLIGSQVLKANIVDYLTEHDQR